MAELHSNQVSWSAPEPAQVSLERRADYVSPAFERLLDTVNEQVLPTIAQYQDEAAADAIRAETEAIKSDIEKEQSVSADYEGIVDRAVQRIGNRLNALDPATRERFMRANPEVFNNARVYFGNIAYEKMGRELTTFVENKLPLWTSEAIMSGDPNKRQEVYRRIEQQLKPFGQDVVDNMVFKANEIMDSANASNLLMANDFDGLEKFLANPKESVGINAAERSVWYSRMAAKKAQIAEEERTSAASAAKAEQDSRIEGVKTLYDKLDREGRYNEADALWDAVYQGNALPTGQWAMTTLPSGIDFPLPQTIDLSDLTVDQRTDLIRDLNTIRDRNPDREYRNAEFSNQTTYALSEYNKFKDEKDSRQTVAINALNNLIENRQMFATLERGTQEEVLKAVQMNMEARAEALSPTPFEPFTSYLYKDGIGMQVLDLSPLAVIRNAITGAPISSRARSVLQAATGKNYTMLDEMTPGSAYIYGGPSNFIGETLATAVENYKNLFGEDIERDSLAEYALYNMATIVALQGTEQLSGTGLNGVSGEQIQKAFVKWSDHAIRNGLYNTRATDSNRDIIDQFYSYVLNREPNSKEKEAIKTIKEFAATGQPADNKGVIMRALTRPEPKKIYNVSNVYPNTMATYIGVE